MNKSIRVDFDIRSDLYNLKIIDNSCWGIAQDLPAVIEITLPGYKKPYANYFSKKDTYYDSLTLGLVCGEDDCDNVELPDGIYHVLLKASPPSFRQEYYYLKTDKLQKEIDQTYLCVINDPFNSECKTLVTQAKFLLESAEMALRKDDIKMSAEYYDMAIKMVNKFNNCKTCK